MRKILIQSNRADNLSAFSKPDKLKQMARFIADEFLMMLKITRNELQMKDILMNQKRKDSAKAQEPLLISSSIPSASALIHVVFLLSLAINNSPARER